MPCLVTSKEMLVFFMSTFSVAYNVPHSSNKNSITGLLVFSYRQ